MTSAKQRARNQHFCPQLYLKGFCFEDERSAQKMWRYSVRGQGLNNRARPPKTVCSQDYFYDTPLDHIHPDDVQQVDEHLSRFENDVYAPALRALIRNEGRGRLTRRWKSTWARIVLSQQTRTPAARQRDVDITRAAFVGDVSKVMEKPVRLEIEGVEVAALHANRMGAPILGRIADEWVRKFEWIVVRNATDVPLLTSDNPVCYARFDAGRFEHSIGACREDSIHFFPLSSSLLLLIARPWIARSMGLSHPHVCTDERLIHVANERQLFNAQEYVLGRDRDYMSEFVEPLHERLKRMYPSMWTGDEDVRRAIEVDGESLTPAQVMARGSGASPMRLRFGTSSGEEDM